MDFESRQTNDSQGPSNSALYLATFLFGDRRSFFEFRLNPKWNWLEATFGDWSKTLDSIKDGQLLTDLIDCLWEIGSKSDCCLGKLPAVY